MKITETASPASSAADKTSAKLSAYGANSTTNPLTIVFRPPRKIAPADYIRRRRRCFETRNKPSYNILENETHKPAVDQ